MCYPGQGTPRSQYHPYRYHRPLPDREIAGLLRRAGFVVHGRNHFLFVLKSTRDGAFPLVRMLESVAERTPLLGRLAATVRFVATRP